VAGEILRVWPFPLIFGDNGNNSLVIDDEAQIPNQDAVTGERLAFSGSEDQRSPFAPFAPSQPNSPLIPGPPSDSDEPFGPELPEPGGPPPIFLPEPITGKINETFPVMRAKLFDGEDHVDASQLGAPIIARGGNGDDTLIGSQFGDKLFGNGHNDTIKGLDGDDIIEGGNGQDTIEGGDGNDCIDGGDGQDKIEGNAGNDLVLAGAGDDIIDLGIGKDGVETGAGNDTARLGIGRDIVFVTKDDLGTAAKPFSDTIIDFSVEIRILESPSNELDTSIRVNNGDMLDFRPLGATFIRIDEVLGEQATAISVYLSEEDFNSGDSAYDLKLNGVGFDKFEEAARLSFSNLLLTADGTRLRLGIEDIGDGETVQ